MFRKMLEDDRKRAGWSIGQAAWRLGVSVRELPGDRGRRAVTELRDVGSDLQAIRLAADVRGALDDPVWIRGGTTH
jgi:hypothetical protein